ncbi:alkaline shock response membrane anchor protein AmaP [Candidatus Contubernalis alkaliaceticus]|uniref:alkaline shock response membrane anchor protein AmaP n=1 Tax=Candidatus Contubernalis alkaliaceticus TaxID=338645 RepID=UPI001F4C048A|nr:alkaline shock response membrane anchor protein AmaP [Candidatus Contubernalis alkalaceticus]UNC92549.1 alkaline shock response membrane anchor protein AmaP [Candidatus Contubernalis alkalaceticus]
MKLTEKFFLVFMALLLLFISIGLFFLALPLVSLEYVRTGLGLYYGNLWLVVPSLVLLSIALPLLLKGLKVSQIQKYVSLKVALGDINISVPAVENLVQNAVSQKDNSKVNKIKVRNFKEGIGVSINISSPPQKNIPQLVEELQMSVKEHLELMTGILVVEVKVVLDNLTG